MFRLPRNSFPREGTGVKIDFIFREKMRDAPPPSAQSANSPAPDGENLLYLVTKITRIYIVHTQRCAQKECLMISNLQFELHICLLIMPT